MALLCWGCCWVLEGDGARRRVCEVHRIDEDGGLGFACIAVAGQDFGRVQFIRRRPVGIHRQPGNARHAAIGSGHDPGEAVRVVVGPDAEAQPDLFEVAHAIDARGPGFGLGERGQEQTGENGDDGNND